MDNNLNMYEAIIFFGRGSKNTGVVHFWKEKLNGRAMILLMTQM